MIYTAFSVLSTIHVVQMVGVKNGYNQVRILCIPSILQFFLFRLFETFNMSRSLSIDFSKFFLLLSALISVFRLDGWAARFDLFWDLLVCSEFLVNLLLGFVSLSDEHLPASNVIHCLILMCKEVSLDKRTIFHRHFLPLAFDGSFALQIG